MLGAGVVLAVELLLGSLAFLVIHAFAYYGARTLLRSNPNASGPVTYEFSAGGASYAGPTGHGQIEWTAYLRIRETSEQFLLYVQKHLANVIPKRVFNSDTELQRFRNLVREHFRGKVELLE
jgi:hypothetical protein